MNHFTPLQKLGVFLQHLLFFLRMGHIGLYLRFTGFEKFKRLYLDHTFI